MNNPTIADVLRAEAAEVDLQGRGHEVKAVAMREDGAFYTMGYVSASAIYQDTARACRAISDIKFTRFLKDEPE